MKTKKMLLILSSVLLVSIICDTTNTGLKKEGKKNEMIESFSMGLAKELKTDDVYVQNSKDYKTPAYVDKLPPKAPISDGKVETIDEVPSTTDYYDGTKGLKTTVSQCYAYTTQPEVCLHQGKCGWCGSTNSCIPGNNLGPLAPCLRGTYMFTTPTPGWNPFDTSNSSVNKVNVGGAELTTIVTN